jgi:hypothetical protein
MRLKKMGSRRVRKRSLFWTRGSLSRGFGSVVGPSPSHFTVVVRSMRWMIVKERGGNLSLQ